MDGSDDSVRLEHMLEFAKKAIELSMGSSADALQTDQLRYLALQRLVEMIGEAATRVSPQLRNRHPELPWPGIIGMRNRLIHGYDHIILSLFWDVLINHLPPLRDSLQRSLRLGAMAKLKPEQDSIFTA